MPQSGELVTFNLSSLSIAANLKFCKTAKIGKIDGVFLAMIILLKVLHNHHRQTMMTVFTAINNLMRGDW